MFSEESLKFERFDSNPLLEPRPEFDWEARAVFNPAAIYLDGKIHLLYRAMSEDGVSVLGYAQSEDGVHIDYRSDEPVYTPRKDFEKKKGPGNSGCEDPRLTRVGNKLIMAYTAFNGKHPTRVAVSKIDEEDFIDQNWDWSEPELISPPGIDDKNSCIVENNNRYVIFHRIYPCIWIDTRKELNFSDRWIKGSAVIKPRTNKWDSRKVGIAAPPLEVEQGYLLLYHGADAEKRYRVGAVLLDKNDLTKVLARTSKFLLEPEKEYELKGMVPNIVFPCGAVIIDKKLLIYYGAADRVVAGARIELKELVRQLRKR